MRPTLTRKLLIILLLGNTLLVAAMMLANRWSFQTGFRDYLEQVEAQRLRGLADALVKDYAEQGSWDFIRYNHMHWEWLVSRYIIQDEQPQAAPLRGPAGAGFPRRFRQGPPGFPGPPGAGPPGAPPGFRAPPAPQPGGGGDAMTSRLRLLDGDQNNIVGPPEGTRPARRMPLEVDGKTVGWLSLTNAEWPADDLDKRFSDQQLSAMSWIGGGALLLAFLISIPLGRHLLVPIKALTRGARELTAGHFATRLKVSSRDELGELAHDFNVLAEALERNERLRRQAMADVSHELRTPLSVLRAEIEALQDGIRPCDGERLASLHRNVHGLSRLVDDLYDLALTDVGALNYRKQPMDLGETVRICAAAMSEMFRDKGLSLEQQVDEPLPVLGDAKRLRQVIDNLLKNSLRYTDPGGTTRISARRDGALIRLDIMDTAPGVAADALPRLFDRFFREESSRDRARGGAGLGLAICKNIVEAHDGRISARPSPDCGLWIAIELPAGRSDEE